MKGVIAVGISLCLVSCTKIVYTGDTYPASSEVDIYYDKSEISRDYEIFGMLKATGGGLFSGSGFEGKLIKQARKRGADAILLGSADESTTDRRVGGSEREMGKLQGTRKIKWERAYLLKYR